MGSHWLASMFHEMAIAIRRKLYGRFAVVNMSLHVSRTSSFELKSLQDLTAGALLRTWEVPHLLKSPPDKSCWKVLEV